MQTTEVLEEDVEVFTEHEIYIIDNNLGEFFPEFVTAPLSVGAEGDKGTYSVDTSFMYLCIAHNEWRRLPLTTW